MDCIYHLFFAVFFDLSVEILADAQSPRFGIDPNEGDPRELVEVLAIVNSIRHQV